MWLKWRIFHANNTLLLPVWRIGVEARPCFFRAQLLGQRVCLPPDVPGAGACRLAWWGVPRSVLGPAILRKCRDCLAWSAAPVPTTGHVHTSFCSVSSSPTSWVFLSVVNWKWLIFVCFFPSPKNPHRCLAVTSLWMTNTLSLALGIRKPRFMKLFIKDKSSCELDPFSL